MARSIHLRFAIDDVAPARIGRFTLVQTLGLPPRLDIEVRYLEAHSLESMLGQPAYLEFGIEGETAQHFAGVVEEVSSIGTPLGSRQAHAYVVRVVPRIALLARSVDSRIFQDMDVKAILESVLNAHGITDMEWRLSGSYPKREYCVQYQESALAFVTRLMEEEGIYYFVETKEDKDVVVFADDSSSAEPLADDPELPVRPRAMLEAPGDAAMLPADQMRVLSGKFSYRDYEFKKPKLDLTASAEASDEAELEIYDYPGLYFDPAEGKRLVKVRLEAERSWRNTVRVRAACPRAAAGRLLKLSDAADLDGEHFVVRAVHSFEDARETETQAMHVDLILVPKTVRYRLPRRTPRPIIHGPQTARVVVPAGSPTESIHTDKHGRCKVKFHWDRSDIQDDRASCWMRVSQMQTSGSLVLPRIDWEVIVEFLEGNPDRPVITGRLYNGVFMPPYALPEGKTRTSLKTSSTPGGGGTNEIRFEDKAGAEEIMIHAQKDMTITTANNKTKNVGNNETLVIASNASLSVGANQTVKITKGTKNTIGADQSVTVGGNRNVEVNALTGLTVHGAANTSVGGNQFEMDGNPLDGLLAVAAQRTQEFLAAKANQQIAAIEGAVQSRVGQVMGPINGVVGQAQALGNGMQAVHDGDMSAVGGLVGDAAGMPGAGDMARSLGVGSPGPGGSGGSAAPAGGPLSDVVAAGNALNAHSQASMAAGGAGARSAAQAGIAGAVASGHSALSSALGIDAAGGGGSSMGNAGGPAGDVAGIDETDRTKGPGHTSALVKGTHSETVGGMKILGVLNGIQTNVATSMTQDVGAAHVEIIVGNRGESVQGTKMEKALGLVVLSKAGEAEAVAGAKTCMVGGAIIDKLKGSHAITAGGNATFIGAFHKLEAKGKITLKCGGSEIVIDSSGITVTSPMVTFMAAKLHLPKAVTEA